MKKVYTLVISFSFIFSFRSFAQPIIEWSRGMGGTSAEYGYAVKHTSDGGYITAGSTHSFNGDATENHGYTDFFVKKVSSKGGPVWSRCYGNSCGQEAKSIDETSDGGYIIAGYTFSCNSGQVSGTQGDNDFWIVKINSAGDPEWQKSFGGSYGEIASSVIQTSDGGYIVCGTTNSINGDVVNNHGSSDVWVVKLSSTGMKQWAYCYGGSDEDKGSSIIQAADGGYVVAATSYSTDGDVTGNHGGNDYWVFKIDITGAILWKHCYGGSGTEEASSIRETADGGYVVAGSAGSTDGNVTGNHGNLDYWIVKINPNGSVIEWANCYGGTSIDIGTSVNETSEGGFIVAGYSSSNNGNVNNAHGDADYWLVKLFSTGSFNWGKNMGGTNRDEAYGVEEASDGGYIITGRSASQDGDVTDSHGPFDVWVVKLEGLNLLANASTTVTRDIFGYSERQVNDNDKKLVTLEPSGTFPLSGSVTTTVNITATASGNPPYVRRQYAITPANNAANVEAIVTLYFSQQDFDDYNAVNPGLPPMPTGGVDNRNVRISKFPGNFSTTSDNSPTYITPTLVAWDEANSWWIVQFPVVGFSRFYVSTANIVLPLTLVDFKGEAKEKQVELGWSTSNEINTKQFAIERMSSNNVFIPIGGVTAKSIPGNHQYIFIDANPIDGINNYRLRMIDRDGRFSFSHTITIKLNTVNSTLSIHPNPLVSNVIPLHFTNQQAGVYNIRLISQSGQVVLTKQITITNSSSTHSISLNSNIKKGQYFLEVTAPDKSKHSLNIIY